MISRKKRMHAVARILAEESTAKAEASRLGTHERTVERWVAAARKVQGAAPAVADHAVSEDASPLPESPDPAPQGTPEGQNPALKAALNAGGEGSGAGGAGAAPQIIGKVEQLEARADLAAYCIEQVNQIKLAVGSTLVGFRYSPPLSIFDPKVIETLQLGPMGKAAIQANAATLYPILTKAFEGKYLLFAALAWDTVLSMVALHGLAVKEGWKAPEKKKEAPDLEKYAEQLRPKAAPAAEQAPGAPPPAPKTEPKSEAAKASIKDAAYIPHPLAPEGGE